MTLTNSFKEFRRQPRKEVPGNYAVSSRASEKTVSCIRHNRVLVEFNKTRRNKQLVTDLMDKTFALRTSPDLYSLFKEYPFLQDSNQVFHCINCIQKYLLLQCVVL